MNIKSVLLRETDPANFFNDCDIKRAVVPIYVSPILPSNSAFGTNAATESTTTTSTAPDFIKVSAISNACSPESGCEIIKFATSTPNFLAYDGSKAFSASIYAHVPPFFCASATACKANVVLPEDSGPYISTILPRG